eukprot:gnl/TRDRNA2_/TRDRNA2_85845_c0_seq1.p1 gnl/TRDRNA2_/TRDRNA2_85845_c0~~gnl/TRDRNA2_/TRDRNA2_85845_c0_seq1.p1  ORF type:complete len:111 (-),score=44.63 gnl/TRDRNA2_/TRDRNA2_85845_c0_seq1:266-598(-)
MAAADTKDEQPTVEKQEETVTAAATDASAEEVKEVGAADAAATDTNTEKDQEGAADAAATDATADKDKEEAPTKGDSQRDVSGADVAGPALFAGFHLPPAAFVVLAILLL